MREKGAWKIGRRSLMAVFKKIDIYYSYCHFTEISPQVLRLKSNAQLPSKRRL
jgi:hypothetical protein